MTPVGATYSAAERNKESKKRNFLPPARFSLPSSAAWRFLMDGFGNEAIWDSERFATIVGNQQFLLLVLLLGGSLDTCLSR